MKLADESMFYFGLEALTYPIVLLDSNNKLIWKNKKFVQLKIELEFEEKIATLEKLQIGTILILNNIYYELHLSKTIISNNTVKIVSFFNITKRKVLEEKVKNRQRMFEKLSEQLPEPIAVFNEKIEYTNEAFEKLIGYSSKYLKERSFNELLDEENQIIFNDNLETLLHNKKDNVNYILSISKKNGTTVWINLSVKVLIEDDKQTFICVMKDISSLKKERDELEQLATKDALTQIFNRRKFNELIDIEYKRAKRYERSLSMIFFDIDHFKRINDNFGHDVGDDVLKEVSQLVSTTLRNTDTFARWGGEEFVILLPETNISEASEIAEKIREKIETTNFQKVKQVTISLGVTQLKKEYLKSFLKRVDSALYEAKESGRNRVISR